MGDDGEIDAARTHRHLELHEALPTECFWLLTCCLQRESLEHPGGEAPRADRLARGREATFGGDGGEESGGLLFVDREEVGEGPVKPRWHTADLTGPEVAWSMCQLAIRVVGLLA
ncbi:MAG: hypothetical protein WC211_02735 [Dehalococcoidia bacterium]